jgi:plastocyanin
MKQLSPTQKSEPASLEPKNPSDSMKRRSFFGKAGLGSAALAVTGMGSAALAHEHEDHQHEEATGPLASATVSFGQWQTTPPFDRFPNINNRNRNQHQLIPYEVTIRAGGSVNFIIAGFHHIVVYGNGTRPEDINVASTIVPSVGMPDPLLINDPVNRVYRGLDPSVFRPASGVGYVIQDRVEVVHFHEPGLYLVICGVLVHFNDGMIGYVRVLPCHCQH